MTRDSVNSIVTKTVINFQTGLELTRRREGIEIVAEVSTRPLVIADSRAGRDKRSREESR